MAHWSDWHSGTLLARFTKGQRWVTFMLTVAQQSNNSHSKSKQTFIWRSFFKTWWPCTGRLHWPDLRFIQTPDVILSLPWPKAGLGVIIVSLLVRESHRSNRAAGGRRWLLGPGFRTSKGDLSFWRNVQSGTSGCLSLYFISWDQY